MNGMRRGWILLAVLVAMMAGRVNVATAQVATTTVQDTVYSANGTPASGTVLVSWNAFTTAGGQAVAAGSTSVTIGAGGSLTLALAPNAGSTPMGSYYTAVFHLSDGTTSREYWVVPVTVAGGGPATLAEIKNQVLPVSVAMQTVSKSYVDAAIAAAASGFPLASSPYVLSAGSTMTGPLGLPADPVNPNQADKNYVDESVASVAAGAGQKVSLLPGGSQTVVQPNGTSLTISGGSSSETFTGAGVVSQANITAATAAANPGTVNFQMQQNSMQCYQPGFDLGNNGTSAQGWSYCGLHEDTFLSGTRGIMQRSSSNFSHFGQGDTADQYGYLTAFGGKVATSDEGVSHTTKQVHQVGSFSGPIDMGAGVGSNLIGVSAMNCSGYCITLETRQFADGGIMLDGSQPLGTATLASEGNATVVPGSGQGMYYTLGTGTVPVSSAWGNIVSSSCTPNGGGAGQAYVSTTCTVTLGTSPASPGGFVAGKDIFLDGPFEEEAAVTAVGAVAGGAQSVTFSTRYAWNGGWNPLVMQGGPGGESFLAAGGTPVAYWVVGATSPTQVFFANCVIGSCNGGSSSNIIGVASTNLFNQGATLTRSGNVVTMTNAIPSYRVYFLPVGSSVVISGFSPADLNGTFTVTSNSEDAGNLSVTWAQAGANETSSAFGTVSQAAPGVTFYPSAFITGTNNGVSGNANLATNTVAWSNGDTAVGAATSEFSADTLRLVQGQTTGVDGSQPSEIISVQDDGPTFAEDVLTANNNPALGVAGGFMAATGSYQNDFYFGYRPANNGSILYVQGGEPVSANAKHYDIFLDDAGGGQFGYDPVNYDFTFNQPVKVPSGSFSVSQLSSSSMGINGVSCSLGGSCTIGAAGGGGTVTSVAVGAWPSWLTPVVANATTTPTVGVTAGAIPNSALASSATTVNGQACALGSACTVTAPPAAEVKYYAAAVCDSGAAFASGMTRYDNQAPQTGCVLPAGSGLGYMAFSAAPALPQYAEATVATPAYWTGTGIAINFYSAATTGSVTWEVQTACVAANAVVGAPSFGAAVPVTSSVSQTSDGDVVTAVLAAIAAPGVNGCPSASGAPGLLTYRIFRAASDTAAGNANLLGATLITGRSQ